MALETKGNTQIAGVNSAPANTPKQEKTALVKFAESEAIARMRAPQRDRTIATSRARSADHFTVDPDTIYQRQAKSNNIYLDPLNQQQWGAQLADSQSGWEKLGNSITGFGVGAAAGFLEGFGSWDMHELGKIFSGAEDEDGYADGNIFFKWSKALQEYNEESNPIFYDKDDMLAGGYWANKFKEMGVTAGIMGEAWAEYAALTALTGASGGTAAPVTGAVGAAKAARTASLLARAGKAILTTGKAIPKFIAKPATWGVFQGLKTVYMNAHETQESTYNELVSKGMSHEEALKHANEAATIGARTEFLPTIALNTLSWGLMGRIGKATKSPFNLSGMNKFSYGMSDVLENGIQRAFGIDDIANTALRRTVGVGAQMVTEGLEEGWEAGVSNYAKWQKMSELGYDTRDMSDAIFDENFRESLIAGAFGGAFFYGMGKGFKKAMDFYNRDAIARENKEKMETLSAIKESFNRANKTVKDLGDSVTEEERVSIRRNMSQRNVIEALKFDYRHQTTDAFDGYIASIDHGIKLAKEGNTQALAELGMEGLTVEELTLMREQAMQAKQNLSEQYFNTDDDFGIALEQVQRQMGIENLSSLREKVQKKLDEQKAKTGYDGLSEEQKKAYKEEREKKRKHIEYSKAHINKLKESEEYQEALKSEIELENQRRVSRGEQEMTAQEVYELERSFLSSKVQELKLSDDEVSELQKHTDANTALYDDSTKDANEKKTKELLESEILDLEEQLEGIDKKIAKLQRDYTKFSDKKEQRRYRERLIRQAQGKLNKRIEEIKNNPDLTEDEKIDEIRKIQGKRERLRTKIKRWFETKKKNDDPVASTRERQQRRVDLQTPTTMQEAIRQTRTPANPNGVTVQNVLANQSLVQRDKKTSEHYVIIDPATGLEEQYQRVHSVLTPMYPNSGNNVSADDIINEIEAVKTTHNGNKDKIYEEISKILDKYKLSTLKYTLQSGARNKKYENVTQEDWENNLYDTIKKTKEHFLMMGNTVDSIVREFFITGNEPDYSNYSNQMTEEAFKAIVAQTKELKDWADKNGYTIVTESVVLWHTFKDENGNDVKVAGEVDVLITDASGNIIGIADIKTSVHGLLSEGFTQKRSGASMSSKEFYTHQLSTYADLLEGQYGIVVDKLHLAVFKINGSLGVIESSERMDISENIPYEHDTNVPLLHSSNPIIDATMTEEDLEDYNYSDIEGFDDHEYAQYLKLKFNLTNASLEDLVTFAKSIRKVFGNSAFSYVFVQENNDGTYTASVKGYSITTQDGQGNEVVDITVHKILSDDLDNTLGDPFEFIINKEGKLTRIETSEVQTIRELISNDTFGIVDPEAAISRDEDSKADNYEKEIEAAKQAALNLFNLHFNSPVFSAVSPEHKYKVARLIANYMAIPGANLTFDSFKITPVMGIDGEVYLDVVLEDKGPFVFKTGKHTKTFEGMRSEYNPATREYRMQIEYTHDNGNSTVIKPLFSSFLEGKNVLTRDASTATNTAVINNAGKADAALSNAKKTNSGANPALAAALATLNGTSTTANSNNGSTSSSVKSNKVVKQKGRKQKSGSSQPKVTQAQKHTAVVQAKKAANKAKNATKKGSNAQSKATVTKATTVKTKGFSGAASMFTPDYSSSTPKIGPDPSAYTSEDWIELSHEVIAQEDKETMGLISSIGGFIDSIVDSYQQAFPDRPVTLSEAFKHLKTINPTLFNSFSNATKFTQMMVFYNTYLTNVGREEEVLSSMDMDDMFKELFDPNAVISLTGSQVSRALDALLGLPPSQVTPEAPVQEVSDSGYVPAGASFRMKSVPVSHSRTVRVIRPGSDAAATLALAWSNRPADRIIMDPQDHYSREEHSTFESFFNKEKLKPGTKVKVLVYDVDNPNTAPKEVREYMQRFIDEGYDFYKDGEITKWDELADEDIDSFIPIYYVDEQGNFLGYMPNAYVRDMSNYQEVLAHREAIIKHYQENPKAEPITTIIQGKLDGRFFTKDGASISNFNSLYSLEEILQDNPGTTFELGYFHQDANGGLMFITADGNRYYQDNAVTGFSLVFDHDTPTSKIGMLVVTPNGDRKILELQTNNVTLEDADLIIRTMHQAYWKTTPDAGMHQTTSELANLRNNLMNFILIPEIDNVSELAEDQKLYSLKGEFYFDGKKLSEVLSNEVFKNQLKMWLVTRKYHFDAMRYGKLSESYYPMLNSNGRIQLAKTGISYKSQVHKRLGTNVRLTSVKIGTGKLFTPYLNPVLHTGELSIKIDSQVRMQSEVKATSSEARKNSALDKGKVALKRTIAGKISATTDQKVIDELNALSDKIDDANTTEEIQKLGRKANQIAKKASAKSTTSTKEETHKELEKKSTEASEKAGSAAEVTAIEIKEGMTSQGGQVVKVGSPVTDEDVEDDVDSAAESEEDIASQRFRLVDDKEIEDLYRETIRPKLVSFYRSLGLELVNTDLRKQGKSMLEAWSESYYMPGTIVPRHLFSYLVSFGFDYINATAHSLDPKQFDYKEALRGRLLTAIQLLKEEQSSILEKISEYNEKVESYNTENETNEQLFPQEHVEVLNRIIASLESITQKDTFEKLMVDVQQRLTVISKATYTFSDNEDGTVDIGDENTEADVFNNFSETEIITKDTLSQTVKRAISGALEKVIDDEGNLVNAVGLLGLEVYIGFNQSFNDIEACLAYPDACPSDFDVMMSRLAKFQSRYPYFEQIIKRLTDADKQTQNAFVYAMKKNYATPIKAAESKKKNPDGSTDSSVSIIYANSKEGANAIINTWRREMVTLFSDSNGSITDSDKQTAEIGWHNLQEKIKAVPENEALPVTLLIEIQSFFSSIGVNIPMEVLHHINSEGLSPSVYKKGEGNYSLRSMLLVSNPKNKNTSPFATIYFAVQNARVGSNLEEELRESINTKGIMGSFLFTIAESTAGSYSKTYRDGGKVLSTIVLPRYANDAINRLKNDDYRSTLANDVYASTSMWFQALQDKDLARWFSFNSFSSEAFTGNPDSRFTELTSVEKEAIEEALYRDTATTNEGLKRLFDPDGIYPGLEYVFRKAPFPTMSDKTQMFVMNAPSLDTRKARLALEETVNSLKEVQKLKEDVEEALKAYEDSISKGRKKSTIDKRLKELEEKQEALNAFMNALYEGNPLIKEIDKDGTLSKVQEQRETIENNLLNMLIKFSVLPDMRRVEKYLGSDVDYNVKGHTKSFGLLLNFPDLNSLEAMGSNNLLQAISNYASGTDNTLSSLIEKAINRGGESNSGDAALDAQINALIQAMREKLRDNVLPLDMKGKYSLEATEALEKAVNASIATSNMFSLIIGDPAYYVRDSDLKKLKDYYDEDSRIHSVYNKYQNPTQEQKDEFDRLMRAAIIDGGGTNMGKRLSLLTAQGYNLANSENDQYLQVYLEDLSLPTSNLLFMMQVHIGNDEKFNARKAELEDMVNKAIYSGDDQKALKAKSEAIAAIEKEFPQIAPFLGNSSTDAQEYTTTKEHVDILFRQGRLSEEDYNTILEKVEEQTRKSSAGIPLNPEKDLLSRDELKKVMQPLKPVYTGTVWDEASKSLRPMYVKSSSFPLIPQVTLGTELDNVRIFLEKLQHTSGKNVRASYDSANKVGSPSTPLKIWNADGTFNKKVFEEAWDEGGNLKQDFLKKSTYTLDRNNFKIQLDVPYKDKDSISIGTQLQKLLFGDGVMDLDGFIFEGKKYSGIELQRLYNDKLKTLIDVKKRKLFLKFGLDSAGRMIDPRATYEQVRDLLLREAKKKGWTDTAIHLLETTVDEHWDGTANNFFSMPLFMMPNAQEIATLLHSFINKEIFSIKVPGYSFVGGSEAGFKFVPESEYVASLKSNTIYTSSWQGSLKAAEFEYNEDGSVKNLKYAQVMMPSKIRDNNGDLIEFIDPKTGDYNRKYVDIDPTDGTLRLKEGMFDMDIFKQVSFRIPTSSLISSSAIEIVGILPPEAGDLIIVPTNFTTQKGMDFDIDKENIYSLYTYVDKEGKIMIHEESSYDYDKSVEGTKSYISNPNSVIYNDNSNFLNLTEDEVIASRTSDNIYRSFAAFKNSIESDAGRKIHNVNTKGDIPWLSPLNLTLKPDDDGFIELEDGTRFKVDERIKKDGVVTLENIYQAAKTSSPVTDDDGNILYWQLGTTYGIKRKPPLKGSFLYIDPEGKSDEELQRYSYDILYKKLFAKKLNEIFSNKDHEHHAALIEIYHEVMGDGTSKGTHKLKDSTGEHTYTNQANAITELFYERYIQEHNITQESDNSNKPSVGTVYKSNTMAGTTQGNVGMVYLRTTDGSTVTADNATREHIYQTLGINISEGKSGKKGRVVEQTWNSVAEVYNLSREADAVYIVGNVKQSSSSLKHIYVGDNNTEATTAARAAIEAKKPVYAFIPKQGEGELEGYWVAYDYHTNKFVPISEDNKSMTPPLAKKFFTISAGNDLDGAIAMERLYKGEGTIEGYKSNLSKTFTAGRAINVEEGTLTNEYLEKLEKSIKNDFVKLTLSVIGNPNYDIQKIMASALSMDVAKEQVDLLGDDAGRFHTFTTRDYHIYKSELGAVGRMGIGVYSNAVVTNSLLQQARAQQPPVNTSLTPGLVHRYETQKGIKTKVIDLKASLNLGGYKYNTETSYLGDRKKTLDEARSIAEVLAERQNTATDNEKEQIMGRLNVNEFTIGVDTMLSLMGFDLFEYTIPETGEKKKFSISYAILTSKYVKKFVEEMKKRGLSSFDDYEVLYDIVDDKGNPVFPEPTVKWDSNGKASSSMEGIEVNLDMNNLLLGAKGREVPDAKKADYEQACVEAFKAFVVANAMSKKTVQQNKYVNVQKNKLGIEFEESWKRMEDLTPDANKTKDGYILNFSRQHTLAQEFYEAARGMYMVFQDMYFGDMGDFLWDKASESKFNFRIDEFRDLISTRLAVHNLYKNHGINYNMLLRGSKKAFSLAKTLAIVKASKNVPLYIKNNYFMQKVFADDNAVKVNYDGSDQAEGVLLQNELMALYNDDTTVLVANYNNTGKVLTPKMLVTLMAYRSFMGVSSRYGNFRKFIPLPLVEEIFEGLDAELDNVNDPSWSNRVMEDISSIKSNRKIVGNFRIFNTEYTGLHGFLEEQILSEESDKLFEFDSFMIEAAKRHDARREEMQEEDPNNLGPVKYIIQDRDAIKDESKKSVYGLYDYNNATITLYGSAKTGHMTIGTNTAHGLNILRHEVLHALTIDALTEANAEYLQSGESLDGISPHIVNLINIREALLGAVTKIEDSLKSGNKYSGRKSTVSFTEFEKSVLTAIQGQVAKVVEQSKGKDGKYTKTAGTVQSTIISKLKTALMAGSTESPIFAVRELITTPFWDSDVKEILNNITAPEAMLQKEKKSIFDKIMDFILSLLDSLGIRKNSIQHAIFDSSMRIINDDFHMYRSDDVYKYLSDTDRQILASNKGMTYVKNFRDEILQLMVDNDFISGGKIKLMEGTKNDALVANALAEVFGISDYGVIFVDGNTVSDDDTLHLDMDSIKGVTMSEEDTKAALDIIASQIKSTKDNKPDLKSARALLNSVIEVNTIQKKC